MNNIKVLILGGTGMLGHKLWQRLSEVFPETYVTIRKSKNVYKNYNLFNHDNVIDNVDVQDTRALCGLIRGLRPSYILNCIGVTKRNITEDNISDCIFLNALLPHKLATLSKAVNAKVINFSTDCVFDGTEGGYTESSLTTATDMYGKTKAIGEINYKHSLTLRSSFIGRELSNGTELLEWCLSQSENRINGYQNAIYSGITTIRMSEILIDIMSNYPALNGLYNIAGQKITKYELLESIRKYFGLDVVIDPNVEFNCDRSLDSNKFQAATMFTPPGWDLMLRELADDPTPYDVWKN